MSEHLESKVQKGEISHKVINHTHTGEITELYYKEDVFRVSGDISDIDLNTELKFSKDFDSEQNAKAYLEKVSKKHPVSEIILIKITKEDISHYI